MTEVKRLLYEGKAKQVFETQHTDEVIIHFKDTATAFNGKKSEDLMDKGIINNAISNILFHRLEKQGIKTHLVKILNDREVIAQKIDIIPLEVVVRNIVAGSLAKRTGLKEGENIDGGILEFYYKDDDLGDPLLNKDHIELLTLATKSEVAVLEGLAHQINQYLIDLFKSIGLILVDFKLEFGRYKDQIILGDEISPDTCRLWDSSTKRIMDKDRFRKDLGDVTTSYREILDRLKQLEA
ncbi:MAG TPA: phosphoribosylaminoimidazolesuccinocarboxamide synthase [Spirochaetes bacterium]|nr:phosphoribosylaminoimidazolesuccinocarboxamide synthase [Spirochaetota bacterium]